MTSRRWVIREIRALHKDGDSFAFYWYGPEHGLGRTWGGSELAAVFPTKKQAEIAYRSVYGRIPGTVCSIRLPEKVDA